MTPEGVLLVQCMFANTPESVGEQLPLADPSGRVWIVKRGHLNNIDELRGRLRDRLGADARVHTDAEVMLAAYLAWGAGMAGRLNGEFTLAIWDGRDRSLFVLRDHLGRRGCYTHDGPEWYVAASEPAQVLPFPGVSDELDELAVVDYISGWPVDRLRTFFAGIHRPLPATAVMARCEGAAEHLYWTPSLCTDKATQPPSDYAPTIYQYFERSVRASLRSSTPVLCDLSGGLDSAAVVGMAAKLCREEPGLSRGLSAHSYVYPGRECDESNYIQDVLAMWPMPWIGRDATIPDEPDLERVELARSMRWIVGVRSPAARQQMRWMRESDVRVQLNGDAGDALFHSGPLPLDPSLRTADAWPRYVWWTSRRSLRLAVTRVRREVLRRRTPEWALRRYLQLVGFDPHGDSVLTDKALALHREVAQEQPAFSAHERAAMDDVWNPGALIASGANDAVSLRSAFELRAPLANADLVSAVLAVPLLTHRWNARWRALQREAFASLYPASVAARTDKAEFSLQSVQTNTPQRSTGVDQLVARGLVDGERFQARCEELALSRASGRDLSVPWSLVTSSIFGRWLSEAEP